MILSLSILGIFLSAILLYFNARNYLSAIYLGIFFFLVSLYNFNQYVILESKSVFWVSLVFLNIGFLSYLIGPMLYWYVRSVLTDDPRLKKSDLWHLLPMLIFFLAILPHLYSSWSHKVEIATKIVDDIDFLRDYKSTFLNDVFNSNVVYLSRPVLVLCYAVWSLNLFLGFLRKKDEAKILNNQHLMTKWLSGLFAFLTIWFVGHTLQIIDLNISGTVNVFYTLNILQIISGAGLIGLLVLPFFFPAVLYGMPEAVKQTIALPLEDKLIKAETEYADGLQDIVKKSENRYGADYLQLIHQKVDSCIKDTRPYLRSDCNLGYLSTLVDVPVHHLSHYFREEKKQAFTDYRNGLRIGHAKSLILEGMANDLTLEAIGMLSGFTNRNTFFISFKKIEGVSPKEFLALQTQETTNR